MYKKCGPHCIIEPGGFFANWNIKAVNEANRFGDFITVILQKNWYKYIQGVPKL